MVNYPQYIYPTFQNPYLQPQIPQNSQTQQSNQQNQQQTQQQTQYPPIRNNGFIVVPTEEDAYRYPVAQGNCVTCKVENEPIVIEKSMSFSQLDNPRIERYRLVREEVVDEPKIVETIDEVVNSADDLKDVLEGIREELNDIKKKLYSNPRKKREDEISEQ